MEGSSARDSLTEAAEKHFSIRYLYPYQRLVITNILGAAGFYGQSRSGRSRQIAVLPTGSGKSLCYMLPGILLGGIHVLVFPLLSLMEDQRRRLAEAGCRVHMLRGGQSQRERTAVFSELKSGGTQFLITNPEMLAMSPVIQQLRRISITHLVVDEAHTVSEWGDTFRPSLAHLAHVLTELSPPLVTACTATASVRIIRRLQETLFKGMTAHVIQANPDRMNIRYRVIPSLLPMHDLADLCGLQGASRPAVIFCPTRKNAWHTAQTLSRIHQDANIRYYHAGLSREEKKDRETWFLDSRDGILCSTTAFGLGIDKRDIRTVIHTRPPETIESYLQETGRAGRDNEAALALLLISSIDLLERRSSLLPAILSRTRCRREALLAMLDARPESCTGCDVCADDVWELSAGESVIREAVSSHPYRHDVRSWARLLCGCSDSPFGSFALWRYREYGALAHWSLDEAAEAINALVKLGVLKRPSYGPWRGKLRQAIPDEEAAVSLETWNRLNPKQEAGIRSVQPQERVSRGFLIPSPTAKKPANQ